MISSTTTKPKFPTGSFIRAFLINTLWINASEVFRYFAFVMPMMRKALPSVENVAPMNAVVFAIWGGWDTILIAVVTLFVWLFLERFGYTLRNATIGGTLCWMSIFVILWLGLFNMNLATPKILAIALPLALLELLIAAYIVKWTMAPSINPDDA
jgi:hypothetical protein